MGGGGAFGTLSPHMDQFPPCTGLVRPFTACAQYHVLYSSGHMGSQRVKLPLQPAFPQLINGLYNLLRLRVSTVFLYICVSIMFSELNLDFGLWSGFIYYGGWVTVSWSILCLRHFLVNISPHTRKAIIYPGVLCRWLQLAQLAKGKKSRP